ncbi:MAG: helix-turn-helix domain-containing protein [Desulfobulbaceae bacterium]|nr:helix-turn-helix domain-containing protein [Desulfobulbaceae bacterium]
MMNDLLLISESKLIELLNEFFKNYEKSHEQSNQPVQPDTEKTLISTSKLIEILGVSRTTIYKWRRDGKIPYFKIGKMVYFDLNDIMSHINKINLGDFNSVQSFIDKGAKK